MAENTNINLRNQTVYQVFVRQHSETQDFFGVIKDLDRIKAMGVDIIYLLPFHKIGKKDRKGDVGSPYAIYDYYSVDPLHGTIDDFKELVKEVHKRQMKIMIDIVFNHTSRDSVLTKNHPDWFYTNQDGSFANRIGDWADITDLHFNNEAVWEYLNKVMLYWAPLVDGVRCDVAPLVPLKFWEQLKTEVNKIKPDFVWLTESVEYGFIKYLRDMGFDASTDSMMYQVFDVCYDYDIHSYMDNYLSGKMPLSRWLEEIIRQEVVYPKNYVKLRAFENHDQERIASKVRDNNQLINLTAMQFFIKGMPMIYAGQEHLVSRRPSLFEHDLINWDNTQSIELLIAKLAELKKDSIMSNGVFNLEEKDNIAVFSYKEDNAYRLGIFNLENIDKVKVNLKDGIYTNKLDNKKISVKDGFIELGRNPIIIDVKE